MSTAKEIISLLQLEQHPEGGYYKETYRSDGLIKEENLGKNFSGSRNYCTGIYFLLTSDTFSAFHKINQDEMWHFYQGSSIKIHMISDTGTYSNVTIGSDLKSGYLPQFVVPANFWFAAEVLDENSFSLVGCTVSPGFDFKDFNLPSQDYLISEFPEHSDIIKKFTRV